MKKIIVLLFLMVFVLVFGGGEGFCYPENPITFVVPFSAGGGSDVLARTIVDIIREKNLVEQPISIENRAGAGGAIGYSYIAAQEGNPYVIGTISSSWYTGPILGHYPFPHDEFQPVAGVAQDSLLLCVPWESPYYSLKEIIQKSKETPGSVTFGVSGTIGDDAVLAYLLEGEYGLELPIVNFESGGEVLINLMGEHIDAAWLNPSEASEQLATKMIRPLVASSPERLEGFPNIQTLREIGIDAVVANFRGVLMPKGVPGEAVKYWEEVMRQVAESDLWQEKYIERYGVTPGFVGTNDFLEMLDDILGVYRHIFTMIGEI